MITDHQDQEREEERIKQANKEAVLKALKKYEIVHVDLSFRYRYSNDEGDGQAHLARAVKTDGAVINWSDHVPQWNAPKNPPLLTTGDAGLVQQTIELQRIDYTHTEDRKWAMVVKPHTMTLDEAFHEVEFVTEDFMQCHGRHDSGREPDDEGGENHYSMHEGEARLFVATGKVEPLDEKGNVKRQTSFYGLGRRW